MSKIKYIRDDLIFAYEAARAAEFVTGFIKLQKFMYKNNPQKQQARVAILSAALKLLEDEAQNQINNLTEDLTLYKIKGDNSDDV